MKVIFIWGPKEVGKASVGREISKITGFRPLYAHNMMKMHSILFHWVYGRFLKVEMDIYFQILDELLESDIPGIILTKVRYLNRKRDNQLVETVLDKFRAKGVPIQEVELFADIDVRLERTKTELRSLGKPYNRIITTSEQSLRRWFKSDLQVNSPHPFGPVHENYLKIDTSHQTVAETTQQIMDGFHIKPKV
ncbi:MAG: hypothetical protein ACTSYI_17325 [Promethearchaeota archaeon]